MKLEIYQIGKVPPLTAIECDDWSDDCREPADLRLFKNGDLIAVFLLNNIAGFKVINEDDEIKEATKTDELKPCP